MAAQHWLSRYIAEVGEIRAAGGDTEGSYRTAIDNMLKEAAAEFGTSADILQEPGRTKDIGAPDFMISAEGGGVIGYVECKKPGADLHKETTKAQIKKYRALSENILLTDSFRWMHLREGKVAADVSLTAKPDKKKRDEFVEALEKFMITPPEKVADSKRLVETLARRCAMLREGLAMHESNEQSQLHGLLDVFCKVLDRDLDFARFADIFAQTLVYSLLMAKLSTPDGEQLELDTARRRIPENFAIIREITWFLAQLEDDTYEDIRWIVRDILAIINGMDRAAIAESMSYKKGVRDGDDPYINFYEDFLAKYDAKLRKSRGVYYTPPKVVRFIVRAADDLLRRDFDMPEGLAEVEKITALDFAAGTGTFLLEMAKLMLDGKSNASKDMLVRGHFLPNFYGFELMTSAYVISHLKLSRFLEDNGIALKKGERIKAYLANTLERIDKQMQLTMMPKLAHEVKSAEKVKNSPVLVIVGNPPYSGISQNKSEEEYEREHKKIKGKRVKGTRHTWIGGLLRGFDDGENVGGSYYEVDGKPLGERKHWLQDDYVKFIRFAQYKMDQVPNGIVAIITNHGFLDNPTFRGMRQSLMNTFDALYFLDLHGNAKKQEQAPGGGKDENVFDIQQGVAISLMVKNPAAKKKGVFHADMWGLQEDKHTVCNEYASRESGGGIDAIEWSAITPASPFYLFIPHDSRAEKHYRKLYSISNIFLANVSGIITARDHFAIDTDKDELLGRMRSFIAPDKTDAEVAEEWALKETRGWKIPHARAEMAKIELPAHIKSIAYRPFDMRYIMYHSSAVDWGREKFMSRILAGENLGLVAVRQVKAGKNWQHCFVGAGLIESTIVSNKTSEVGYLFPLYTYHRMGKDIIRMGNFTAEFRRWIDARYGEAHKPEDILGYIYAALHSPDYRYRYAAFLRTDTPRIPFPESNDEFKRLATIGNALIAAHLLRENCSGEYAELCGDGTSHKVDKVRYDEKGGLHFNKDEYFDNIPPEVFNFQIGGYKPLDKYLKSRKGLVLTMADIRTIKKAANAIAFTIAKMGEIDG